MILNDKVSHNEVICHDMRFLLRFDSSPCQFRALLLFILVVSLQVIHSSYKSPHVPTVPKSFKMSRTTSINLLEIPLPLEWSVPKIVEQQRLLNQVLISRSIGQGKVGHCHDVRAATLMFAK